jgi:hypothetical protein
MRHGLVNIKPANSLEKLAYLVVGGQGFEP